MSRYAFNIYVSIKESYDLLIGMVGSKYRISKSPPKIPKHWTVVKKVFCIFCTSLFHSVLNYSKHIHGHYLHRNDASLLSTVVVPTLGDCQRYGGGGVVSCSTSLYCSGRAAGGGSEIRNHADQTGWMATEDQ